MDKNNLFNMDEDYDFKNDSLLLYINQDYNYKESIKLGNNFILDFDDKYVPVALEILNASRVLGITKVSLKKGFNLDMEIKINEKSIEIKASFQTYLHQKEINAPINATIPNNMNIPDMKTHFAVGTV